MNCSISCAPHLAESRARLQEVDPVNGEGVCQSPAGGYSSSRWQGVPRYPFTLMTTAPHLTPLYTYQNFQHGKISQRKFYHRFTTDWKANNAHQVWSCGDDRGLSISVWIQGQTGEALAKDESYRGGQGSTVMSVIVLAIHTTNSNKIP